MVVLRVERVKPLALQNSVEESQSAGPVRSFVEAISGTHELIDQAAEQLRRMARTFVRLSQNLVENVRNPLSARRAVVSILGIKVLKELRNPGTRPVGKVLGLILGLGIVTSHVTDHQVSQRDQIPALELHPRSIAAAPRAGDHNRSRLHT